jgi:hypothetical protein
MKLPTIDPEHRLPLLLIAMACVGYIVIVRWLS